MFSVLKQLREKSGTANVLAPYTPTPDAIVSAALEFAGVGEGDVVYDVGCGDARLLTAAIERGAVKAVGWDIDTKAIEDAQERIDGLKLGDRVSVSCEDVFTAPIDWAAASVIVLYLSVQGNLRLRPILLEHAKKGARVVTIQFNMGELPPTKTSQVPHQGHHSDAMFVPLHLYEISDSMPILDSDAEIQKSSSKFVK